MLKSNEQQRAFLQGAHFYGILDTGYLQPQQMRDKCLALQQGGADIIQLRAKRESRDEYRELLKSILPVFDGNDIPLIINDDLELALEFPRCGLHVGQDDLPVQEARRLLGPNRILGLSTHSMEQAEKALQLQSFLTYFCIGPVFPTGTKPDYVPVGLNMAREVWHLNQGQLPLFAIGGINRGNARQVHQKGIGRVVVVSDVLLDEDTAAAVKEIRDVFSGEA